ncbi:hypothetical protein AB0M36_26975 [Actinoplanes sp. NPDC051346]|uniref:hypothetical protein n=1 Tax=Actinoplanes sp. NPDC051346 TaxID=3155048 RepID=UPI003442111A
MKLSRLKAVIGAALVGMPLLVSTPAAAAAGGPLPGPIRGMGSEAPWMTSWAEGQATNQTVRATRPGSLGFVWLWMHDADNAEHYHATVSDGTTTTRYDFWDDMAAGDIAYPDAVCQSYKVTAWGENQWGRGPSQTMTQLSLAPSMVMKPTATRGADGTTATFSMQYPQWWGYQKSEVDQPLRDDSRNPKITLQLTGQLVRMSDNRVVATAAASSTTRGSMWTKTFTGLNPKNAYVFKVNTANAWGSCGRQQGKILLKARK